MSMYILSKQDLDPEIQALLVQWGGQEIIDFVSSEAFAGRVYKYEAIAIRFKDKIPTLKKLLQHHLLFDSTATGLRQIHLTFIGFLCSDGFESRKEMLEKIFYKVKGEYEATEGEGEISSEEISKSIYGEKIAPKTHKTTLLLIRLFITAPVNILNISREADGILNIRGAIDIVEYKSCARYISACVEAFNKLLQAAIHPGTHPAIPPALDSKRESDNKMIDELDIKLPILSFNYIKNNFQPLIDSNIKNNLPVALIMIDIDHFKNFNTNYGLLTGDDVLIATAGKIRDVVGEKGKVVRFGGEEITVILPNYTIEEARGLAERIRQAIEIYPFKAKKNDKDEIVQIRVSLGVAGTNQSIEYKLLIDNADEALRVSKAKGRNRVTIYNEELTLEKKRDAIQTPLLVKKNENQDFEEECLKARKYSDDRLNKLKSLHERSKFFLLSATPIPLENQVIDVNNDRVQKIIRRPEYSRSHGQHMGFVDITGNLHFTFEGVEKSSGDLTLRLFRNGHLEFYVMGGDRFTWPDDSKDSQRLNPIAITEYPVSFLRLVKRNFFANLTS